jgi:hypothetical protein
MNCHPTQENFPGKEIPMRMSSFISNTDVITPTNLKNRTSLHRMKAASNLIKFIHRIGSLQVV